MKKLVAQFEVYTFHIDFSGHVSNIVYVQWMEITRLKLLADAGASVQEIAQSKGVIPVLTDTQISYKKALYFGDSVRVEAWFSELRPASAWVEYRFYNQVGDLAASGRQKGFTFTATHCARIGLPLKSGRDWSRTWSSHKAMVRLRVTERFSQEMLPLGTMAEVRH